MANNALMAKTSQGGAFGVSNAYDEQTAIPLASLSMNNNGVRNQPVKPALVNALQQTVTRVYGPGYSVSVMSGAQPAGPRGTAGTTGSRRHGTGDAADIIVHDPNGNKLSPTQLMPLAQQWLAGNVGSVGFPANGSSFLHLDLIGGTGPGSIPLQRGEGRVWYYGDPTAEQRNGLTAALDGKLPPRPPMNIPEVASAYADTSLPPPVPQGDPRNSALDAIAAEAPTNWNDFYRGMLPTAPAAPAVSPQIASLGSPQSVSDFYKSFGLPAAATNPVPQLNSPGSVADFYRGFGLQPAGGTAPDLSAITPNQSSPLYLPPAMDAYYGPNGEPPIVPANNAATLGATQMASLPPTDGLSQIATLNPLEGAGYLAALNPSQTIAGRDITGLPFDQTGYMSDAEANSFHGDPAYDEGTTPLPRSDPRGYAALSMPLPHADPRGGLSDLMRLLGAEPAHPTGVSLPDVPSAGPNAPYDVSYGTPPRQTDMAKGAVINWMSHPGPGILQPVANTMSGIAGWLGNSGSATPAAAAPAASSNSGHSDTSWDDLVNSFSIPTAPANSGTSSMARNGVTSAAARNAGPGADLASLGVSPSVSVPKYITVSKQVPVPSNRPIETGSGVHWDDAAGNFVLDAAPKAAAPTYRTQQVQVLNPKYVAPPVAQPAPVVPLSPPQDELARLRDEQQNPFQSLFSNSLFGKALGFGDVLNNGGLHYGTTPGLLTRLVGGIAGMGNSGIAAAPAVDLYHGAAYASAGSNNASAARNQSPGGSLTGSQWRNGGLVG